MSAITEIQREIKNGHLALTPKAYRQKAQLFGTTRVVPKGSTPADRIAKARRRSGGTGTVTRSPASVTTQVGDQPKGYGKYIGWSKDEAALALTVFLNAGDPLGVAIQGVTEGDTIELVSAAGLASFSEETENEYVSSIIGIIAAGADVAADDFGAPEAKPVIDAGRDFAQNKFKEKQVRGKVRGAYGVDPPSSPDQSRQEGGVLVCKPEAHGPYYSGEDERFWIKRPGNRIDAHRPAHLGNNAYFIRRGMGKEMSREAGDLYMVAWDMPKFEDNFGFYELHVIMRRGDLPPVVPVDRRPPGVPPPTPPVGPPPPPGGPPRRVP